MVIADRGDRAMSPEAVARRLRDLLLERLGSGVVAIWHYGAATFCPRMGEPRNARRSAVQDGFGSMGVGASSAGVRSHRRGGDALLSPVSQARRRAADRRRLPNVY